MIFLFALLFAGVIAAHFFFARRAWLQIQGVADTAIDLQYVRRDDWLAQSFRARLAHWIVQDDKDRYAKLRRYRAQGKKLVEQGQTPESTPDVYSFENDFACVPQSTFARELSVLGCANIGAGSSLQAVTAGGSLQIGEGAQVARWADADGEILLARDVTIGARATSRYAIRLGHGCVAKLFSAPLITTDGYVERFFDRASVPARGALQIPVVKGDAEAAPEGPATMVQMDENCVLWNGDLHFSHPVEIRTRLVVKGSFSCPSGSLLHEDIKAEGDLSIGPESLVLGNLVAGRNLALYDGCQFEGVLHAGGDILLATGVRGRARRQAVAAYATKTLYAETNVAMEGKLAAGEAVRAVKFWRK